MDAALKAAEDNTRRCKGILTLIQRLQMKWSQTLIIIKNLKQEVKHESYNNMEVAFMSVIRQMGLNNIKVNYMRDCRGQKATSARNPWL